MIKGITLWWPNFDVDSRYLCPAHAEGLVRITSVSSGSSAAHLQNFKLSTGTQLKLCPTENVSNFYTPFVDTLFRSHGVCKKWEREVGLDSPSRSIFSFRRI